MNDFSPGLPDDIFFGFERDVTQDSGNGHDPDPAPLQPDNETLLTFVATMFRRARSDGFVSFRIFEDNGKSERPVLISACRLDDTDEFGPLMLIAAEQAATWFRPAVFAPPVCTFKNHRNAKTDNLHEGVAISAECDQGWLGGFI